MYILCLIAFSDKAPRSNPYECWTTTPACIFGSAITGSVPHTTVYVHVGNLTEDVLVLRGRDSRQQGKTMSMLLRHHLHRGLSSTVVHHVAALVRLSTTLISEQAQVGLE